MVDEYLERRNKGKKFKQHKAIDAITKNTQGIIVYQEQVMNIANQVAGMTWGKADEIRKVVAKSKGKEAMKKYEDAFVSGCISHSGVPEQEALNLWENIEAFGSYSFNMSHAVEYTLMAYWGQWLKVHYEPEFLAANLTYGDENDTEEIIKAAKKSGYKIKLPKLELSDATNWMTKGKDLYCPFIEVKGIGDVFAKKAAAIKIPKRVGFFNEYEEDKKPTKIKELLKEIGAFDMNEEPKPEIQKYFSFNILNDQTTTYPNLAKLYKSFNSFDFEAIESSTTGLLIPDFKVINEITDRQRSKFNAYMDSIRTCKKCSLSEQCEWPVLPSVGDFNIAIIGEAPGVTETEKGMGFVGKSGKLVWDSILPKHFLREDFLVTNVCKCQPVNTKTPAIEEICDCKEHLENELEILGVKLAIVFGNTGLFCFKGIETGITKYNATTEWNERFGLWVCYCIHPASVLRDPNKMQMFEDGINNFVRKINLMNEDLP
jgi:uracil-DNA glycosylase family 4